LAGVEKYRPGAISATRVVTQGDVWTVVLGALLGRKGKPCGKVKLGFHLFFFLWFSLGYFFIAQALFTGGATTGVGISVIVTGLALLVQIGSGITLLARKERASWLPTLHAVSAALVLIADGVALFLSATRT